MAQEIINQAIKMFDNFEKWNAFIDLSNNRLEMRRRFFEKLKIGLSKHFIIDSKESWSFKVINNEQYRWFLTDFGQESICLLWRVNDLILWCNPQFYDAALAKELLSTPDFNSIFNCFDYTDTISNPHINHFCEERHRYYFEDLTSYIAPTEEVHDKLAWFAGNKTSEMIQLIAEKINRFRTIENTELLKELNKKCKKP